MSVLIKGMKMPKNCRDCIWLYRDKPAGKVYCTATNPWLDISDVLANSRHPDCPLVEIPPHGRLIDADVLEHIIGQFSLNWEYGQGVSDCWDALLAAPTVIEAEEGERCMNF